MASSSAAAASSSSPSSSMEASSIIKCLICFLSLSAFVSSSPTAAPGSKIMNNNLYKTHQSSKPSSSRIQHHLNRLNKPPITSIQSLDGDIIDCVLISTQPALDHPKLRHHRIQLRPPPLPPSLKQNQRRSRGRRRRRRRRRSRHSTPNPITSSSSSSGSGSSGTRNVSGTLTGVPVQLWQQQREECPSGTIPVRRTKEEELLRAAGNVSRYGRKRHRPARPISAAIRDSSAHTNATTRVHQHAIVYVEGDNYYGARATMNVWNPMIDAPNEFSLSQVWILGGSFDGDLNSIEAGWQVTPELYGDNNTRLFTYWTSDAYKGTGCYNLLCSGFVQISGEIALGATISPLSAYDDKQFDIDILIWKDPNGGDWWMSFGENHVVGYWPSSLFTFLADSAAMVQWGGEVVDKGVNGRHTKTQMGSGHFASEGFGRAAYFSNLQVVDTNNILRAPTDVSTFSEDSTCYNVQNGYNENWGYYFYFGGPGLNDMCP